MQASSNLPPKLSTEDTVETNDIICPIGRTIMFNPVTASCGHAFEEENLETHLLNDKKCLFCKEEITHFSKTSIFIKDAIEKRIADHPRLLEQQHISEKIVTSVVTGGHEGRKNFLALVKMNDLQNVMATALIARARKRVATKPKEALADCLKARELNPTNDTGYVVESLIYIDEKKYHLAKLACDTALHYNRNNGEAYSARALLKFKLPILREKPRHSWRGWIAWRQERHIINQEIPVAEYTV